MGSLQAHEMAEMTDLETALRWHLGSNHYPPVPKTMVQPCADAIEAVNNLDYNKDIELPNGVLYKGLTFAPACVIVEQHHLEAWITEDL